MILISSHTDILHDPHVKQICTHSQHTSAGLTILNVPSSPKQLLPGMPSLKVWSLAPHWMRSRRHCHWGDRYHASVLNTPTFPVFSPPTYFNPAFILRFYLSFIFYLAFIYCVLLFTNIIYHVMRTDTCNKPHTLRDAVTGRNRITKQINGNHYIRLKTKALTKLIRL